MEKMVIAFGGNALERPGESPKYGLEARNVEKAIGSISHVFKSRTGLLLTHGNGTQVGVEYLRNRYAHRWVAPLPFQALNAETQATIGTLIETAVLKRLKSMRVGRSAVALLTHVLVSPKDRAFRNPSKPVGPVYSKTALRDAHKLERFRYVRYGNGYRRVVASPFPKAVSESRTIKHLVESGRIVIAGGGGGIPIIDSAGTYPKSAAVIDKDLTAGLLATSIGAKTLVILTSEDYVYRNYPDNKDPIRRVHAKELDRMLNTFDAGTMRPKVQACVEFIEHGGKKAFIGRLWGFESIIRGTSGTMIVK